MKNFSLPRMALILWFVNYTLFSLFSYLLMGGVRHEISSYIVYAAAWVVVELMCLGWIEDKF
jgi:hypothetical protein